MAGEHLLRGGKCTHALGPPAPTLQVSKRLGLLTRASSGLPQGWAGTHVSQLLELPLRAIWSWGAEWGSG